jgi:hypothetical protein
MSQRIIYILPVAEGYGRSHPLAKPLEPIIGDPNLLAYSILASDGDYHLFRDYSNELVDMALDGLPEGDGVAPHTRKKWLEFWNSPAVQLYLELYYEEQERLFRMVLGNQRRLPFGFVGVRHAAIIVEL